MRRVLIVGVLLLAACGDTEPSSDATQATSSSTSTTITTVAEDATTTSSPAEAAAGEGCAHVVDATISDDGGTFTIAATVSSNDTGWDKYADAWQVWDEDGAVLGERILTHPHENEQPFTRSQGGITIPEDLATVTIAARDSVLGFCGDVLVLEVPGR